MNVRTYRTSTGPRRSLNLALVRVCIDLGVMPRNRIVEAGGKGDEVDGNVSGYGVIVYHGVNHFLVFLCEPAL